MIKQQQYRGPEGIYFAIQMLAARLQRQSLYIMCQILRRDNPSGIYNPEYKKEDGQLLTQC